MGQIQNSINQTIGTAAVLASLSPAVKQGAEARAEVNKLNRESKILSEQAAVLNNQEEVDLDQLGTISDRLSELDKRKFELNPNDKTYTDYYKSRHRTYPADPEEIREERAENARKQAEEDFEYNTAYRDRYDELTKRQKEAMKNMQGVQQAKKAQRRNFMDYLKKQPVYGGETVGSINERSPGFAKQIASQYTRGQRKQMMDRMDMEAMKSGK